MQRLHVIGGKHHGKTTLVVELVSELTRRGVRVGTIKHTHHRHELDVPGKDSHRHRLAGANVVGILSPSMNAVFMPRTDDQANPNDPYDAFAPLFADCQCVIVEGDVRASAQKVEVWRASLGTPPLAANDPSILAIVTDDDPNVARTTLARSDPSALADWVLAIFQSPYG